MTKKILLLLADGFEPLEAAGFTDVMGWANLDGEVPIEVVSAGLHTTIGATFAYRVQPDYLLADLQLSDFDAVAIPGGMERGGIHGGFYKDAYSEEFQDAIRHFSGHKQPVASVCVASLALGSAGILKDRRATVYHQIGGNRKTELEAFGANFIDNAIVKDQNIITSTGPGTSVEVAFELLAQLSSASNVRHIRQLMRIPTPSANWRETPQVAI